MQKGYKSDIQSINQVKVPAIKFLECILMFMIPIALLQKVGCLTFISNIDVFHMTARSCKSDWL